MSGLPLRFAPFRVANLHGHLRSLVSASCAAAARPILWIVRTSLTAVRVRSGYALCERTFTSRLQFSRQILGGFRRCFHKETRAGRVGRRRLTKAAVSGRCGKEEKADEEMRSGSAVKTGADERTRTADLRFTKPAVHRH
jgi:hypothetical protein